MSDDLKIWLAPMFTLSGTLIVVVFTAWLNNNAIFAHMEALRQEVRADAAALKLDFRTGLMRLENKLDHVIETQTGHSERLDKLDGGRK